MSQYRSNGVMVPTMPAFQPATDDAAKASMLSQAVTENDHFTFPADRDFWNNFVTQVRMYPGAMDPPQFHVDASHTDESVLVNQEFMRRFVAGWQNANPHVVTINSPTGQATFHSSEEFWNGFVMMAGERTRMRQARGELGLEDYTVMSSLHPGGPVRTTAADWNEYCEDWDARKGKVVSPPPPAFDAFPSPQPVTHQVQPIQQPPPPPAPVPTQIRPDPMVPQLQAQLEAQRQQAASANAQQDGLRRQVDELQRQLSGMHHQAQLSSGQLSEELRRAQADAQRSAQGASRNAQETESLREANRKLQMERDGYSSRINKLEQALQQLQSEAQKQRDTCNRELAAKDREMEEVKQMADLADLKKELQMRELMQEELFKAKEESQREADEKCRFEMMKSEAKSMRVQLCKKQCASPTCSHRSPQPAPVCNTCVPVCDPPPPQPLRPTAIHFAGQRTVATQTAPKPRTPGCFAVTNGVSPGGYPALPPPPPGQTPMHMPMQGQGGSFAYGAPEFNSPAFAPPRSPRSHAPPPPSGFGPPPHRTW